jgi:hypothetical protein
MMYKREKTAMCLRDDQLGRLWKFAAVALVACVAVAALAWFRPWEGVGVRPDEEPRVEWRQFRSTVGFILENTEDNLSITDVAIYAPFPQKFENLYMRNFYFVTAFSPVRRGNLIFFGRVLENTLEGYPPSFTVEYVSGVGYRAVMRAYDVRLQDSMKMVWTYWAPENTSLFDEPDNRVRIRLLYQPEKRIYARLRFELFYEDNYDTIGRCRRHLGKTWWEWDDLSWFTPGWYTV